VKSAVYTSSAQKIALASSGFDVQAITHLSPLASSDEERLAIALAQIGRLHAEMRLHRALHEQSHARAALAKVFRCFVTSRLHGTKI
jgi:hypothetical protein